MKNCSVSIGTKECKYKRIRYYYTSIKMSKILASLSIPSTDKEFVYLAYESWFNDFEKQFKN